MIGLEQGCEPSDAIRPILGDSELEQFTALFKALGHPVRLRIVDLIQQSGGDICVCEFERHFVLTQPTISHHLRVLREAGLIRSRQDGTWVRHAIDEEVFASVHQLLSGFGGLAAIGINEQSERK